jgi:hypothetical protein
MRDKRASGRPPPGRAGLDESKRGTNRIVAFFLVATAAVTFNAPVALAQNSGPNPLKVIRQFLRHVGTAFAPRTNDSRKNHAQSREYTRRTAHHRAQINRLSAVSDETSVARTKADADVQTTAAESRAGPPPKPATLDVDALNLGKTSHALIAVRVSSGAAAGSESPKTAPPAAAALANGAWPPPASSVSSASDASGPGEGSMY